MSEVGLQWHVKVAFGAWGAVTVAACSLPGASHCEGNRRCGGNPIGAWTLRGSCGPPYVELSGLALGHLCTITDTERSGARDETRYVLRDDGTYAYSWTIERGSVRWTVPTSCAAAAGLQANCEQVGRLVNKEVARDWNANVVTCHGDFECTCTQNLKPWSYLEEGRWSKGGNGKLTLQGFDGLGKRDYAYCVRGRTLRLSSILFDPDLGGEIVATPRVFER